MDTLVEHVECLAGPMTIFEATPNSTPGVSPVLIGVTVATLWAGMHMRNTLNWFTIAVTNKVKFGYGMVTGTGPSGVGSGVTQASAKETLNAGMGPLEFTVPDILSS
jgi:hypothetical protein